MASLSEVYGENYKNQSVAAALTQAAKIYATNMSQRQFNFRNDTPEMWQGNNMKTDAINLLQTYVQNMNPEMRLIHCDKTQPNEINCFPYLKNGAVEYFLLVDTKGEEQARVYSLSITPQQMESF
jgi:hypothetical protein